MRRLVVLEAGFVAGWVALATWATVGGADDIPALSEGAVSVATGEETWMGLYLDGVQIGWSRSKETSTADGGRVFDQQARFRLNTMGSVETMETAGSAVTDAQGRVRRFQAHLGAAGGIDVTGEHRDGVMRVTVRGAAGSPTELTLPMPEAPVIGQTLGATVKGRTLAPGERFRVPWFDPLTQRASSGEIVVENPEVLPDGEPGWWLRTDFGGFTTRRLVDAHGRVLREESTMGIGGTLTSVAMTREEALREGDGVPRDIVAMVSVPVTTRPDAHTNVLEVSGYDAARIPNEPPGQRVEGTRVTLQAPLFLELPAGVPIAADGDPDTVATALLPATHPEITARAKAIVGDATDRRTAVERLLAFVHGHIEKAPRIGIPDGLTVLREARGDCNEHTALFVSLARAVGVPARIAAGLVHHPQLGQAFYYHAWPEVRMGPPDADGTPAWVAVDPTFGQIPADATHLKLVTGDLDQQAAILGAMGRIQLRVVR